MKLGFYYFTWFLMLSVGPSLAQDTSAQKKEEPTLTKEEKAKIVEETKLGPMVEPIEFDKIQDVIKKDRLGDVVEIKKKVIKETKKKKAASKVNGYNIPEETEFWSFFSEYWIVKNATRLKWDFKKPDYGLAQSFKNFLENVGLFEIRFKILLVNSPDISHFALPSDHGETIFLLGVPFIRSLDLSKLEISILLLEDFYRIENNYAKEHISVTGTNSFIGGNFYKKEFDVGLLEKMAKQMDEIVFEKGFNFKQQFKVTNRMSGVLKSNPKYWNAYYRMLLKIDNLVKSNVLYQKYLKIYPSPELQIGWLKPNKSKVL